MPGRRGRGPAPRILVVVESPAKCRTIQQYLGPQYVVKASFGHVRDLPVAGGGKRRGRKGGGGVALGVDTESWRGEWVVPKEKAAAVKVLRELAGRKEPVVLATDRDREGEAIAWHLREVLGGRADRFVRVTFNEITRSAVQRAFRSPGRVDMALVRAQLARRFLDRLVGWRVSPALVRATGDARSAGRVQSVALRLVVERERAIRAFRPEPYWEVAVGIEGGELAVWGAVDEDGGQGAFRFVRDAAAAGAVSDVRAAGEVAVVRVKSVPGVRKPLPPFVTATLQQAASARLKMGVKRTMELAQSLYEKGLITYMRTDAVRLAPEAVEGIRRRVRELYGGEYLPDQANSFKVGSGAQEAHEAIRPTGYAGAPEGLEADEAALYDLIERRAFQSQMARARVRRDTVEGEAGGWRVGVSGVAVVFDGFERAWPAGGSGRGGGAGSRGGDEVSGNGGSDGGEADSGAEAVHGGELGGGARGAGYRAAVDLRGHDRGSRGAGLRRGEAAGSGGDGAGRAGGGMALGSFPGVARLRVHGGSRGGARRCGGRDARLEGAVVGVPGAT